MKQLIKISTLLTTLLLLEVIEDALNFKGLKELAHIMQLFNYGFIFLFTLTIYRQLQHSFRYKLIQLFLSYLCFRISLFDLMFNALNGLNFGFIGSTNYLDKIKGIVFDNLPGWYMLIYNVKIVLFAFLGIVFSNEFNK